MDQRPLQAIPAGFRNVRHWVVGVVSVIVGITLLTLLVGAFASTPVDKIGLHYSGGPIDGTKFQGIVQPGSGTRFIGFLDHIVLLPVTQRDYIVSLHPEEGDRRGPDSITAPAKGGVEMQFEIAAYFTLNTSPDVVRRFYERVCVKFACDSPSGWEQMLNNNFRKPIEQAIQERVREHTVNELYAGEGTTTTGGADAKPVLVTIQDDIAHDLKENVNRILGGDYFCGPTFNRAKPDVCPDFQFQIISATPTSDSVKAAFADNAASQQAIITAQNKAQAKVAEAEGQRKSQEALNNLYADPNYIAYLNALALQECAGNSNCTLVVGPGGTNVNVPAGK
jgi:hypothetical protein